jgi:hypothetical protein
MPCRLYKGVGVGTFLHKLGDLRAHGIISHLPGAHRDSITIMEHVARGTTMSPCISLTRSFGVAVDYAIDFSLTAPTAADPAFVYEITLPDPPTGIEVVDPVAHVASGLTDALASPSYHHDGNMAFLLGVVDPDTMDVHLRTPICTPKGSTPTSRPANLTIQLETLVRALRDAEVLIMGAIPHTYVTGRHDWF